VSLNDYYITTDSNRSLYDDQSLQNALESVPDNQRLEIILCRRSATLGIVFQAFYFFHVVHKKLTLFVIIN
jgi:hypothetical protein